MNHLKIDRSEVEPLASLIDSLDIIIIQSTHSHITYMNIAGLNSFGIRRLDDLQYYQRSQLFADRETYQYIKMKRHAYGKVQGEKVLLKRVDQSNFWGLLTSIERIENGKVIFDEVIVDISKEIDQEHKLIEKTYLLEKVSVELDRFIYSASHDLRAPISTMMGLLLVMKNERRYAGNKYLEFMEDALVRLETHIRKLTVFSKITNEPILPRLVDLKVIIAEVISELSSHVNYKMVAFNIQNTTRAIINSDYSNLRTILFQVVKNAFDFVDLNKAKSILSIMIIDYDGKIRIEVVDNGIGIEKVHQENVFKLFYRGSEVSTGNGLGLYLVSEALIKIHATIELQSDFGVGTAIVITIPNLIDHEVTSKKSIPLSTNTDTMLGI